MRRAMLALALALATIAAPAMADSGGVQEARIRADMEFLAGPELQGRASATRDEAIAAAYVASQFRIAGLQPAPGMDGMLQKVNLVRPRLSGKVSLRVGDKTFASLVPTRLTGDVSGRLTVLDKPDAARIPEGAEVVLLTRPVANSTPLRLGAFARGVKLLLVPETAAVLRSFMQAGGVPQMAARIEGVEASPLLPMALLSQAEVDDLAKMAGEEVVLSVPLDLSDRAVTTNVIGYLPGSDPTAGPILLSAHHDHLGVREGEVYIGANDNASGTAAVIELARVLAAGGPTRRGILFVTYGSEELGLLGSRYFAAYPPVPLERIAANLEFELVGKQDPRLAPGALMMTGYERSDFGPTLASMGGQVVPDPYPELLFFQRSDNYALALRGVVAHTVSGWGPEPNYHTPRDDLSNIDFAFITSAIGSLAEPLRKLADSEAEPRWKPGGRPQAN
ncbi:M28 family metallopeptidase [Tsuneonella sp. HG222]